MIKRLFSSLLFFSMTVAAAVMASSRAVSVYADGEEEEDPTVLHGYTYVDSDEGYEYTIRTFDSTALTPSIVKKFCAPSGYTFNLDLQNWQLEEIMDQLEFADPSTPKMVDIIHYYNVAGSNIYADSDPFWPNSRDEIWDRIQSEINSITPFQVEELATETVMHFDLHIQYYTENTSWELRFPGEPITIKPYNEFDFLNIEANYYVDVGHDERVTLYAEPIEGFFYEYDDINGFSSYNENGWHTDETENYGREYDFYAVYELSFYANETFVLGSGDRWKSIEMSFPPEPISVRARITFMSGGEKYSFYSRSVMIGDPHASMLIDGYSNRTTIQRDRPYEFYLSINNLDMEALTGVSNWVTLSPWRLSDPEKGHELYDNPVLPERGIKGHYYYIPTDEEITRYRAGEEIDPESAAGGTYYIWDGKQFVEYWHEEILCESYDPDWNPESGDVDDMSSLFQKYKSIPFIGKWSWHFEIQIEDGPSRFFIRSDADMFLDVVITDSKEHRLEFNVPDNVNLVQGGGSVEIIPSVIAPEGMETDYYFSWEESKEGVLDIVEGEDGKLTITPITHGVDTLTVHVESPLFADITKSITVRVLDTVFDVAKLEVPDEFHYAGKDLTAAVNVRGFKVFQNLEIEWAIQGKDGAPVGEEKYLDNKDATLTIPKAERNDYKITASYEGIELDSIVVEVRSININQFLRVNIWWIVLITLGFVALMLIMRRLLSKGKTTVESIERVYQVFCSCYADDKLTLPELKRIKREINRCVSRCEDLNIEALNQYEKAIRYLKKSSKDTQALMSGWETISPEDKSAGSERLDKDLSKALNVAKEIENAKQLIEQYHDKANRSNFEKLDDGKGKKGK